ncbi:MAG: hypothetical protein LUH82_03035 [Clostridiales bacterium]|nr:hypothetical protein [Clostridiales bacterium]
MSSKNKTAEKPTVKGEKKHRLAIALTAAAAIVLACLITAAAVLSNSKYIYTAAAYLIPQSYTDPDSGVTFYRQAAGDLNSESEEELLSAYSYYYIDDAGEEVNLTDGVYRYLSESGEQINVGVSMGFVLLAVTRVKKIIAVFKIITALLAIGIIIGIISCCARHKIKRRKKQI